MEIISIVSIPINVSILLITRKPDSDLEGDEADGYQYSETV